VHTVQEIEHQLYPAFALTISQGGIIIVWDFLSIFGHVDFRSFSFVSWHLQLKPLYAGLTLNSKCFTDQHCCKNV